MPPTASTPPMGAVHSLLSLLSEVDFSGDAPAALPDPHELGQFSVGLRYKQQLLAARAERLARFLRLQLPQGFGNSPTASPLPRGSPSTAAGSRRRTRHEDSADGHDGHSPCGNGVAQWSPGGCGSSEGQVGATRGACSLHVSCIATPSAP